INSEPNFLLFGSSSISASADQRDSAGYGRLEGTPHNYIHGFVGGDMGNFMSPLDPVFWTHHNMIERCLIQRNFVKRQPDPSAGAWLGRTFTDFCDEDGNPVKVSVAETLLYPVHYYRYDDVGPVGDAVGNVATVDSPEMRAQNTRIAKAGAQVSLSVQKRFA